ncbi:MAG: hypothetical protein GWQ05_17135 [Verrucomicrobiaceae bacterium]|nr:hypothetical protein [Verrucomicrobiaceae bacterium]NCF92656.1 hypothetical protein [Verrucomicrobiaceae bacterium]
MRKFNFPLSLLLLFWFFVSLRGQGDADVPEFVAAVNPAEADLVIDSSFEGSGSVPTIVGDKLAFAGLRNDYLAVFGILVASVILALRRRAHLVFGQHHRRR